MAGTMLSDAVEWLGDMIQDYASQRIRYESDGQMFETNATIGKAEYQVSDGYGGVINKWTDRDFIFPAGDMVLLGVQTLPKEGDEIHELDSRGLTARSFEVMPIPNEQCYRFCDQYGKTLRVHTKKTVAA